MRSENLRKGGGIKGRGERGKPKRSELQRLTSIANGSRSRGPRPENRERVKLNALKHGLRAEHVILPGVDPGPTSRPSRDGLLRRVESRDPHPRPSWSSGWPSTPGGSTCAHPRRHRLLGRHGRRLRLRRRRRPPSPRRPRPSGADPRGAHRPPWPTWSPTPGIDPPPQDLVVELDAALGGGPSSWDRPFHHDRLMPLHGRPRLARPGFDRPVRAGLGQAPGRQHTGRRRAAVRGGRGGRRGDPEGGRGEPGAAAGAAGAGAGPGGAAPADDRRGDGRRDAGRPAPHPLRDGDRAVVPLHGQAAHGAEAAPTARPRNEPEIAPVEAPPPKPSPAPDPEPSPEGAEPEDVASAPGSFGAGGSRPTRRRPDPGKRVREDRQRAAKRPRKGGSTP